MQRNESSPILYGDKFDYCRAVCRTSSRSVVNENQWKSELKYCFPNRDILELPENLPKPDLISEDVMIEITNNLISTQIEDFPELKGKTNEKQQQIKDVKIPEQLKTEEREIIDTTLSEISKTQKQQEHLLGHLEEQMKKLVEENLQLVEENKHLATKLEQAKKGKQQDGIRVENGAGRLPVIHLMYLAVMLVWTFAHVVM